MRWLINYIRSCFCQHDWELIFDSWVHTDYGSKWEEKTYRCKKCGMQKKYKSS